MTTQLTREQKLMAEQVVQLGNIAEAIRAAAMGEDSSTLMEEIRTLKEALETLQSERAELQTQLAVAQTQVATLTAALNHVHQGDVTPDNITEVMQHLNIDYTQ